MRAYLREPLPLSAPLVTVMVPAASDVWDVNPTPMAAMRIAIAVSTNSKIKPMFFFFVFGIEIPLKPEQIYSETSARTVNEPTSGPVNILVAKCIPNYIRFMLVMEKFSFLY